MRICAGSEREFQIPNSSARQFAPTPSPCPPAFRSVEHDQSGHVGRHLTAHRLDRLTQRLFVEGIVGGFLLAAMCQQDAQGFVERGDRIAGVVRW